MAKKSIISIEIMAIISFSIVISTIPVELLLDHLSTYGQIDYLENYTYSSNVPSSVVKLNLNVDVGNVDITYVDPPVEYIIKIKVNIKMSGQYLTGNYSDYFNIDWEKTTSPLNFTLKFKSDLDHIEVLSLVEYISIVVILRKDITFDIDATVLIGDVELTVPFGVSISNVKIINHYGNSMLEYRNCIIGGNITGIIEEGDIELKTYNVEYALNSVWNLSTQTGNGEIEINQEREMGDNITGIVAIPIGDLTLTYRDTTANVGALFTFPLSTPSPLVNQSGFKPEVLDDGTEIYTSFDFPAKNNYNLLLNFTGFANIIELRSE
ncbi:MAG: hypothetical protein ACFFA3_13900 [Promethearchaeota archaeon]